MTNPRPLLPYDEPWLRPLVWLLAATLALFALRQLAPIVIGAIGLVSPFLIALVLAYVFNPVVNFVQQRLRLGRIAGILTLAGAIVAAAVGMALWLIPALYDQLAEMARNVRETAPGVINQFLGKHLAPETLAAWRQRIEDFFGGLDSDFSGQSSQIGGAISPVARGGAQAATSIAGGLLSGVAGLFSWLGAASLIVIITFYCLADMDGIPSIVRRMLPESRRERIWDLLLKADKAVGGFLRGQLIDCACVGGLTMLALFAIGLKQYAILIGCFAGAMNFIPYLGPVAGAAPAILWALTTSSLSTWDERGFKVLFIAGAFAIVQTIDGLLLQPFIVGKHASLHPLAVIFALAIGAQAGIGGMVLAVPLACVVKVLWVELYWKDRTDFMEKGAKSEKGEKKKAAAKS